MAVGFVWMLIVLIAAPFIAFLAIVGAVIGMVCVDGYMAIQRLFDPVDRAIRKKMR